MPPARDGGTGTAGQTLTAKTAGQVTLPPVNVDDYDACASDSTYRTPLQAMTATVAGWADVAKMNGSLPSGDPEPATVDNVTAAEGFQTGSTVVDGRQISCKRALLQLDDNGQRAFPPERATFLAYGFMPVTATVEMTQYGADPLTSVLYQDISAPYGTGSGPQTGVVTGDIQLQATDVTVNGTTLNVGRDCRTQGPLSSPGSTVHPEMLVLAGGTMAGDPVPVYNTLDGGSLVGEATIPPFTGCVTPGGENLDALLDSSISGPGNYVRIEQGPGCTGTGTNTLLCVPGSPGQPLPGPLWTVTHGGAYTGTSTAPLTIHIGPAPFQTPVTVTCSASSIAGTVPDATGPPRGAQATLSWTSISSCAAVQGTKPFGTWTLTQAGAAPSPAFYAYHATTDTVTGVIWNVSLELTGSDLPGASSSCDLQLEGNPNSTYSNSTGILSATISLVTISNTCAFAGAPGASDSTSFSYQLSPSVNLTSP